MSQYIRFPGGYVGVVSDKVAEALARRVGHRIVHAQPRVNTPPPLEVPDIADAGGTANG